MKKFKLMLPVLCAALTSIPAYAFWGSDDAELTELKFSMVQGMQSNEYRAAQIMADYVKKHTDGELEIKLYSDAQLGDDLETMEQMTAGSLDLGFVEYGRYSVFMPELKLLQYPYVFTDFEHVKRFSYTDYFKGKQNELLETYKWRALGLAYGGSRNTTTTKVRIDSVDDIKSLKIRVPKANGNMVYVSELGGSPTPMAFTEVYLALKTNAVDGQENPLSIIDAAKFYEAQKYLALTKHIIVGIDISISDLSWNRIPEEFHPIVKAGAVLAADAVTASYLHDETTLVKKFKAAGMIITEPNLAEFAEAFIPLKAGYATESAEHKKVVDAVEASKKA